MKRRFIYFYFMKDEPNRIPEIVPSHVEYWKARALDDYLGGPFSDRTGGCISFAASDLDQATEYVMSDPFVSEDLLRHKWIKEWIVE